MLILTGVYKLRHEVLDHIFNQSDHFQEIPELVRLTKYNVGIYKGYL